MSDEDERVSQEIIGRLSPVEPSERLKQLIAEIPDSHPRAQVISFPFKSAWIPSVSLAAAALLGLFVGQGWSADAGPAPAPMAQVSDVNSVGPDSANSDSDEPSYDDLDIDHLNKGADFAQAEETEESALEELLVFATTGDFEGNDWSQWDSTDSAPPTEPAEETH